MTETNIEELLTAAESEQDNAEAELAALSAESEALPELIVAAANSGDTASLIELKRRQSDLPVLIFAADVKVRQTKLATMQARQAVINAERRAAERAFNQRVQPMAAEIRSLEDQRLTVQAALSALADDMMSKQSLAREIGAEIARARRALQAFLAKEAGAPKAEEGANRPTTSGQIAFGQALVAPVP